jgi:hypothetical protein
MLAAVAHQGPLRIVSLAADAPGASPGMPCGTIAIAAPAGSSRQAAQRFVTSVRHWLSLQQPPWVPEKVQPVTGQPGVLKIKFDEPESLTLLDGTSSLTAAGT